MDFIDICALWSGSVGTRVCVGVMEGCGLRGDLTQIQQMKKKKKEKQLMRVE